jgi:outer membrane lipoprotein-sorting protein
VAKGAMRRILLLCLFAFAGLAVSHAATPGFRHEFSDADKADLDRVSAYLNAVHTLKGSFLQIGPDGQIDEGVFDIEKPGKMRFEYHAPNPVLIVSDGSTVAVQNRRMNTIDHYPIWSTPLDLILSDDLNLKRNSSIAAVSHEPGEIIVSARSHSSRVNGNITLVFTEPMLELRQWTIIDDQGLSTTVTLRDVQQDVKLDPALFALPQAATDTKKNE